MPSPSMTHNATGNIVNAASIAASATNTAAVDISTKFKVDIQITVIFGTVAATSGLQIDVYRRFGATPTDDTIAVTTFTIPSTASTTKLQSFSLETGKYDVKATNLDATNGVTGYSVTTSTVDAIA